MKILLYPKYLILSMYVHDRHDFFGAGYKLIYNEHISHGMTPWQHYVMEGKRRGFSKGNQPAESVFFREGYEIEYPDVKEAGLDAWRHYAENGLAEGRDNGYHPKDYIFFAAGYLAMYPDVAKAKVDPWHHYVLHGKHEGRDNGLHPDANHFFADGYLAMYPDIEKSQSDPWRHYVLHGKKEGRDNGMHPSGNQFFAAGYLSLYMDVANAKTDPWHHYAITGKKEGRDNGLHPKNDIFFAAGYLEMYPDVAKAKVDPWHHYVLHGRKEGRDNGHHPNAQLFFSEGYKFNYPSCVNEPYGSDLWMNFINVGKKLQRNNGLIPVRPFFYGGYLERFPGRTLTQAWRDYVHNVSIDPDKECNLYPLESGIREVVYRKNPLIAVIMPVYNRKNVVVNAIKSVQKQTWTNWHLYIADDFSNDGTYKYLKSVISDPRITILKSKIKGVCGARNTAIAHIKNEDYVAYLDSDNTWNKEYLELMLCRLIETNTYCCYGAQKLFKREPDGSTTVIRFWYDTFDVKKLHYSNYIDLNVFMHRTCVFKEIGVFDTSLRRMVDWDLILRCAERYSFSTLPYVGCNYDATEDEGRITQKGSFTFHYMDVVRNKYWFDWDFISESITQRDKALVSIVIYFGRGDSLLILRNCLNSLKNNRLHGNSKYKTQVILVDDSCTENGRSAVIRFYEESLIDKYLINPSIFRFPLSCNRALSVSDGSFVVYLDSNSYVSTDWLDPLIDPLNRHQELKGTSAKVLQPDGSINSVGCLFDSVSGLPYDVLQDLPNSLPAAGRYTELPCVSSCCSAFRISDVIAQKGLDCIYTSELTILDLCMRIGEGQPRFAFIPSSIVICPVDTIQHVSRRNDFEAFAERWFGKAVYSEQSYFDRRKLSEYIKLRKNVCSVPFKKYCANACTKCLTEYHIPVYDFQQLGYDCEISSDQLGVIEKVKSLARLVVIKDPAPGKPYDKKYEWGDYYYARSLARAFSRLGFDTRIDPPHEWYSHDDGLCINIVLRGISRFECNRFPDSINAMWLISHPDMIDAGELNEYNCIFAASEILKEKYTRSQSVQVPCFYLPQCTDPEVFSPAQGSEAYSFGPLFLGNSRGVLRNAVQKCIDEDVGIRIVGNGWAKLVNPELIHSGAVPSFLVPFLYRSAETVLNDHWEDMKQNGIVSNRIYDVLACGRGIVTDNFKNIPEELKFACFSYENCSIREAIDECKKFNLKSRKQQKQKLHDIIRDKYSFARRALQIIEALCPILEKRQNHTDVAEVVV